MEPFHDAGGCRAAGARLPGAGRRGEPAAAARVPLRHGADDRLRLRAAGRRPRPGVSSSGASADTTTARPSRCSTTARSTSRETPPTSRRSAAPSRTPAARALPVFCASLRTAGRRAAGAARHRRRVGHHRAGRRRVPPRPTASAGGSDDTWNVAHLAALDIPILQGLCLTSSRVAVAATTTTGCRRSTSPPRSPSPSSTAASSRSRSRSRRSTTTA